MDSYEYLLCIYGRKKKAVHKTTTTDDKRLQSTLKRVGVNNIPGIEEVNIFKDDVVIQFQNPKGEILPCRNFYRTDDSPCFLLKLSSFLAFLQCKHLLVQIHG